MDMPPQSHGFDVGTGELHPDPSIMENGRVDLSVYTSQQRFDGEREVFGRVWLNVAEAATHPDVNRTQSDVWATDQFVVYPHFIFHTSHGGWWLHRFWPVAPGKTYWEAVYHFERPQSLRNRMSIQYSLALNRDTLMEDNLALVQQQQIMLSGAKKWVQFGDQEIICKHLAAVSEAVVNDLASPAIGIAAE